MQSSMTANEKFKMALATSFYRTFALNTDFGVCPICALEMEKNSEEKVVMLACNPGHAMHQNCYTSYLDHCKKNSQKCLCPLCRAEIDEKQARVIDFFSPEFKKAAEEKANAEQIIIDELPKPENEMVQVPKTGADVEANLPQIDVAPDNQVISEAP